MNKNRVPAGVPAGGQFAASAKPDAGVYLQPDGTLRGEVIDVDVYDIKNVGTLARGVSNKAKRDSLDDWKQWASDRATETGNEHYAAFAHGLDVATVTLMSDHVDAGEPSYDVLVGDEPLDEETLRAAQTALSTKRASVAARERYVGLLQHADSGTYNGMMAAGAVLSGFEYTWDLRADRDAVALRGWAVV